MEQVVGRKTGRLGDPFTLFGAISQVYNMWHVTCHGACYVHVGLAWAFDEQCVYVCLCVCVCLGVIRKTKNKIKTEA